MQGSDVKRPVETISSRVIGRPRSWSSLTDENATALDLENKVDLVGITV